MPPRLVTPHRSAVVPVTGHFRTGPDYAGWRPDGTGDFLLVYTISGGGRFTAASGHVLRTRPDEITLIRPGTRHDYGTPPGGEWELLWAHFVPRGEWCDLLDWPEALPGVRRLAAAASVRPSLERLHAATLLADPLCDRMAMNAVEAVLLACERINPHRRRQHVDPRLRHVLDYIAGHLDRPLTVDALAGVAGLSVSRLAHVFRAGLGVPVMQYVETRRLERAAQLLRMSPLGVKQVARQVGFASPFYFSLRFKKRTGRSPTAYREGGE